MQNDAGLKSLLTGPGLYPMPVGEAGIAAVDVRDIGEATAFSLTHEGHAGKSYNGRAVASTITRTTFSQ